MHSIVLAPASDRDVQLMAGVRTGRSEALQELYHSYFQRGFALAWRILADSGAAEDCVHDVFLKLWQAPDRYDPARGAFVHWFLAVVHHRAVNQLRQRGQTQPFSSRADEPMSTAGVTAEPGDRPAGQSSVEDRLDLLQIQQAVRAGLDGLHPGQRAALELAYFGGMSQSQIATHLQLPLGTVKTRIRTAMIRLRATLDADLMAPAR